MSMYNSKAGVGVRAHQAKNNNDDDDISTSYSASDSDVSDNEYLDEESEEYESEQDQSTKKDSSKASQHKTSSKRISHSSKRKGGKPKKELTKEQIEKFLDLNQHEAAKKLSVSLSTLKRRFYEIYGGSKRWPYYRFGVSKNEGIVLKEKSKLVEDKRSSGISKSKKMASKGKLQKKVQRDKLAKKVQRDGTKSSSNSGSSSSREIKDRRENMSNRAEVNNTVPKGYVIPYKKRDSRENKNEEIEKIGIKNVENKVIFKPKFRYLGGKTNLKENTQVDYEKKSERRSEGSSIDSLFLPTVPQLNSAIKDVPREASISPIELNSTLTRPNTSNIFSNIETFEEKKFERRDIQMRDILNKENTSNEKEIDEQTYKYLMGIFCK